MDKKSKYGIGQMVYFVEFPSWMQGYADSSIKKVKIIDIKLFQGKFVYYETNDTIGYLEKNLFRTLKEAKRALCREYDCILEKIKNYKKEWING